MDNLISFIKEDILIFDIIFLLFIFYFSIQCFAKGFFISLMSFLKWVLALVITIILVPRIEPYVADYVKNEYLSGIGLGIAIYILSLFILILVGKSLGRLFSYTGLGPVDKFFGLFFGVFKGYVFIVCIFSIVNWFYSYEKWDMSLNKSFFFSVTEKGSRLLIEEFPERNQIEDTKKEIENI
tara:strand:- start:1560 stop:2105 length:546 start_codon:yes stop_codon:yes gene_type:complete